MYGTGFCRTDEANLYQLESDGLYLTGTSEVAAKPGYISERDPRSRVPADSLMPGYSTCFRRQKQARRGREHEGLFRVHQFDKVEMFSFVEPSLGRRRARAAPRRAEESLRARTRALLPRRELHRRR